MNFSQTRFLSFPLKKQHKKAAELLRLLYEKGENFAPYREIERWLELPPVDEHYEALINRFHTHLKCASISLNEHHFIKEIKRFDHLSPVPFGPCSIYLDHLRSGHNVGSILRTVEAFRLGTVHFSPDTPDIQNKKVNDASMGTAALVPTSHTPLKELPKPLIALETMHGATSLFEFSFPKTFTLLVGNEEYGLSRKTVEAADHILEIPLSGSKNSLNVACAFAIAAEEISEQLTK